MKKPTEDLENIFLRPLTVDDVTDRYVGWLNNPKVVKFLEIRHVGTPFTLEIVKDFVDQCQKNHRHHWGIFVDGQHVGNVSCGMQSRPNNWVDISSLIGEEVFFGTQLAKITLASAMEYLFEHSGCHRVQAGCISNNFSSLSLMTNLGFKKEAVFREAVLFDGKYFDSLRFGILRQEWRERKNKPPLVKVFAPAWERVV